MNSKAVDRSAAKERPRSLPVPEFEHLVSRMRRIAAQALRVMYRPSEGLFVFRIRRGKNGIVHEGLSRRYTAIVLMALAGESRDAAHGILGAQGLDRSRRRLEQDVLAATNAGDVALTLWASCAWGVTDRQRLRQALCGLLRPDAKSPTVEAAWALKALCVDADADVADLRERLARRLVAAFNPASGLFPHNLGEDRSLRSHVTCFADQVYPIQALAHYHVRSGDKRSLAAAGRCAEQICRLQGPAGQWWWHYDRRSGQVVEGYPVYAVHQDAMAPMALFELNRSGGPDYSTAIAKGLSWLQNAPEINRSLVDSHHMAIWRKVDRNGPRKLCRTIRAAGCRVHASWRISWIDRLFRPETVDYECRPYHLAWLLYAWPPGGIHGGRR
jgi:hypothetical protein